MTATTLSRRRLLTLSSLTAMPALMVPHTGSAQESYPDHPVRVIVPYPPGGATDAWARILVEGMQPELGQPLVIDNRGGASGMIGTEYAAKAPPDGYQLLFTITTHVQAPVVMRRFPYDPVNDFAPIGRLGAVGLVFCATSRVPAEVTTLAQFAQWSRNRDLSLAVYTLGSSGHAFTLMLAQEAGLTIVPVPYRGEGPMLQDMISGAVDAGFHSMPVAGEMIRAGRLRPLAIAGAERVPSLPQVPTLHQLGYSDRFSFDNFSGLLAPARTPQPVLDKLAAAFRVAAEKPATRSRLLSLNTTPAYQDPVTFRAQIERSLREWTTITEALDLRVDG